MKKLVVCVVLSIFLLGLMPTTTTASHSYEWNDSTKTATVYYKSNPVLDIKQISVSGGLTTFEEVLEITSHVDYKLTGKDLKWLWKKHRGEHGIRLSELQKLTTESYVVNVPDYGDVEHSQVVPKIISYENVTDEWNADPWTLDRGDYNSKEKWYITYYLAENETYTYGTIGFDRYEVITASPLKIRFYWNEYDQIGSHEETRYRDVFKSFSPVGKTIHTGQTYTIKTTLHKKAELGEFSIHLTPEICGVTINELTWWNTSWPYKIESVLTDVPSGGCVYNLTVHSGSGTNNQTDVFLDGNNATNFTDIRFVLDETTELAYWIEDNTTDPVKVWANVTDNGTVGLYYGNSVVISMSNISNTFLVGDDFEDYNVNDSLSAAKGWTTEGTTATRIIDIQNNPLGSGKVMRITTPDGGNPYANATISSLTYPVIVDYEVYANTDTTDNHVFFLYALEGGTTRAAYTFYDIGGVNHIRPFNAISNWGTAFVPAATWAIQTWYTFSAKFYDDDFHLIKDGTDHDGVVHTAKVTGYNSFKVGGNNIACTNYVDNFRIRKYIIPVPVWSTWSMEEVPIIVESNLQYNTQRKLTRTSEGYLHRVYTKFDGSNYRVYYGKSMDDGNNWVETVLSDAGVNNTHPSIAGDSEDTLWIIYSREGSGIRYRKYEGLSWQAEQTISTDSGEVPVIAVDSGDSIHASWMANLSTYQIRYWNGTNTTNVTSGGNDSKYPSLSIDSNNYLYLAYQKWNSTSNTTNIKYQKYTDSWQSVYNVTLGETYQQEYPCIAVDLSDYAHITWQTQDHKIKYKRYTTSWQATEEVCDGGIYEQHNPSVSVYSTNYVYVTWFGLTAGYPDNYIIREKHWSGSWSAISNIVHPAGKDVTYPNSVSALYPKICGDCYLNIPLTGFSFIYDEDDGTIKYYNASVWRCPDDYVLVIKARDTETNQYITNFTVDFSAGETKSTDSGVVKYTCLESGYYDITVSSNEYHSAQQSVVLDQSKMTIMYLTPITETEYFLPQKNLVEFRVQTWRGVPISNVNVTVQGYEITHPQNWLEKLFGYENATEIYSEQMNGTTDSGGSISFLMIATIKYEMVFTKGSEVNETLYIFPKEDHYKIVIGNASWVQTESMWDVVNYSILVNEIPGNDTHSYINFSFVGLNNATSEIYYFINQTNGTTSFNIYNTTYTGGDCANIINSYIVERGEAYLIGFVGANDDYGVIKHSILVRIFEKDKRLLEFEGAPDYIYDYISIGLLCLVAAFFGAITVPEGGIVVVLGAWILHFIGWLSFGVVLMPLYLTVATVFAILIIYANKGRQKGIS